MATPRGSIFERLRFPRLGEGMRLLFELPDLQAQRRLLDAESLGGSREVSLLGDRNEVAQVSQVHACNTVNVLVPLHPYIGQLG